MQKTEFQKTLLECDKLISDLFEKLSKVVEIGNHKNNEAKVEEVVQDDVEEVKGGAGENIEKWGRDLIETIADLFKKFNEIGRTEETTTIVALNNQIDSLRNAIELYTEKYNEFFKPSLWVKIKQFKTVIFLFGVLLILMVCLYMYMYHFASYILANSVVKATQAVRNAVLQTTGTATFQQMDEYFTDILFALKDASGFVMWLLKFLSLNPTNEKLRDLASSAWVPFNNGGFGAFTISATTFVSYFQGSDTLRLTGVINDEAKRLQGELKSSFWIVSTLSALILNVFAVLVWKGTKAIQQKTPLQVITENFNLLLQESQQYNNKEMNDIKQKLTVLIKNKKSMT